MASYVAPSGEFSRDTQYIETRITADGRDGYPVEPGQVRRSTPEPWVAAWRGRAAVTFFHAEDSVR